MAERYAVATGDWSNVSTWDGGASLPGVNDDVHANSYTVTIDQDITVNSLSTRPGSTASAGGLFKLETSPSASRTVNADVYAGTSDCLQMYGTSDYKHLLNGDSYGSNTTSGRRGAVLRYGVVMTGNAYGSSATASDGVQLQYMSILNGNSFGGSGIASVGASLQFGSVHNGTATGGSNSNAHGTELNSSIFNGTGVGGSNSSASGVTGTSAGTMIMSGITDNAGKGCELFGYATIIFYNGLEISDVETNGNTYTEGNSNFPFINEASVLTSKRLVDAGLVS